MILIIFYKLGGIFIAPVMTAAMTDTLTHKSFLINMNENSYRMKETKTWLESLHVAPAYSSFLIYYYYLHKNLCIFSLIKNFY